MWNKIKEYWGAALIVLMFEAVVGFILGMLMIWCFGW